MVVACGSNPLSTQDDICAALADKGVHALCAGIGREKKRGISTILFACSGAIRAFTTDLDKQRRRGRVFTTPLARRRPETAVFDP